MELYLSIVNFSKTGFLPTFVVRNSIVRPIIVFKETCKETTIGFLQIQFHTNGYSTFYVCVKSQTYAHFCVKSQTYAHSSTCDNNTLWSSIILSLPILNCTVICLVNRLFNPLQHNQFVLISALLYHPQAKFPQSKVECLWMQCLLHGEWVFGFVCLLNSCCGMCILFFTYARQLYMLSLGMDGMFGYWRFIWQ
jgi:hypothetical protein